MNHEQCPRCAERGQDSRKDNLKHMRDGAKHCFACNYHVPPVWEGPEKASRRPQERLNVEAGTLPTDWSRNVPTEAWKWLLQFGLPYSFWKESVGYSEKEGRLYFCVPSVGSMAFSQGRLIKPPGEGKYSKWFCRGDSHKGAFSVGEGKETILVEDWISANKVGQLTECLPLFGVEIHPAHIYYLSDGSRRPIILWLDKDQEGRSFKKAAKLELLTGRPVKLITTESDPKSLSLDNLKEVLNV